MHPIVLFKLTYNSH